MHHGALHHAPLAFTQAQTSDELNSWVDILQTCGIEVSHRTVWLPQRPPLPRWLRCQGRCRYDTSHAVHTTCPVPHDERSGGRHIRHVLHAVYRVSRCTPRVTMHALWHVFSAAGRAVTCTPYATCHAACQLHAARHVALTRCIQRLHNATWRTACSATRCRRLRAQVGWAIDHELQVRDHSCGTARTRARPPARSLASRSLAHTICAGRNLVAHAHPHAGY
jgi:hypothetical protein